MKKEIYLSTISLVCMSLFMIFSTVLYFNKSKQMNNAQVFNKEYSDMAFELRDNHIFVQTGDLDEVYDQKEYYKIDLIIKYRDHEDKKLNINLNFDKLNLDDYKDTIVYYYVINQFNNIVKEKQLLDIKNDKIIILEDDITYSNINYIYTINFEISDKYNDGNVFKNYELVNKLSADLI